MLFLLLLNNEKESKRKSLKLITKETMPNTATLTSLLTANVVLPCIQMLSTASASAPQAVFSTTSPQKPLCRFSLAWVVFSSGPESLKVQTCFILRNAIWFFMCRDKLWHENTRRQKHTSVQSLQLCTAGTKDGAKVGQQVSFPHFSDTEQRNVKILFPTQMCQPTEKGMNKNLICFWSKFSRESCSLLLTNAHWS